MWEKIIAFFMSIFTFFASLFGAGGTPTKQDNYLWNVSYGAEERQIVDIAFPENAKGEIGAILMLHGGEWTSGDKNFYTNSVKYGATMGYVSAAMNYRYVSDKISAADIMDDITLALKCIKNKAAERGITVNKLLITGVSSGAHLALLYAYSKKNISPVEITSVVSFCAPTDLADTRIIQSFLFENNLGDTSYMVGLISNVCGYKITEENYTGEEAQKALKSISPVYFVDKNTVPTVIGHGTTDLIVPYVNATVLDAALALNGVKHDFITSVFGHTTLISDKTFMDKADALVLEYAKAYL